ncbi:hypothetical protein B0H14DRAFT_2565859 [Mycena olivaceomarginata]|nr:hypothetical protein B0H14DRAFT_2565859 [Mycena olivaceomarginata]
MGSSKLGAKSPDLPGIIRNIVYFASANHAENSYFTAGYVKNLNGQGRFFGTCWSMLCISSQNSTTRRRLGISTAVFPDSNVPVLTAASVFQVAGSTVFSCSFCQSSMLSFFMNDWIYQTPHCISALSPTLCTLFGPHSRHTRALTYGHCVLRCGPPPTGTVFHSRHSPRLPLVYKTDSTPPVGVCAAAPLLFVPWFLTGSERSKFPTSDRCVLAQSWDFGLVLTSHLSRALDGQSVQVADRTWTHQSDMARYNSGHELFPTMSGSNAFRFVTVFGAAPLSGVGAALDMFAAFTGCFACIPLRLPCDAPLPEEEARVFCDNCGLVLLLLLRCIIYLTTPHLILEPLSGSISGIARVPAITAWPAKSLDGVLVLTGGMILRHASSAKVLTVEVQRPEESGCRVYLWCSGAEAAKSGNFFRRHLILELAASDPCKWSAIL